MVVYDGSIIGRDGAVDIALAELGVQHGCCSADEVLRRGRRAAELDDEVSFEGWCLVLAIRYVVGDVS